MDITGVISEILPETTGKSAKGEWKKQSFILLTSESYPKKICFSVWNEKINLNTFAKETRLKVFFDIESKEYNGRWFTELRVWKVELAEENEKKDYVSSKAIAQEENPKFVPDNIDELPF
jgi:hypothetical protein